MENSWTEVKDLSLDCSSHLRTRRRPDLSAPSVVLDDKRGTGVPQQKEVPVH